jgi:hypothetical protein
MALEAARQLAHEPVLGAYLEDWTLEWIGRIVDELSERANACDEPAGSASRENDRKRFGVGHRKVNSSTPPVHGDLA